MRVAKCPVKFPMDSNRENTTLSMLTLLGLGWWHRAQHFFKDILLNRLKSKKSGKNIYSLENTLSTNLPK
jgi:hypothetical protein